MSENEINQIMRSLGRIEGILEGVTPLLAKHSDKINTLESAENYRKGQSAVIAFIVSIVTAFASKYFK